MDDYVEKDYILKLVKPFENNEDITISCCGFDVFGEGERIEGWVPSEKGLILSSFDIFWTRYHLGWYG